MIELTQRIRDRERATKIFAYIVLFWGLLGIGLQTARSLLGDNPLQYTLITHFYFTTQSNILVTLVAVLFLFKQKKGQGFAILAFISLVNISVTGIVFHLLLTPYMGSVSFLNHVLHTINPVIYLAFYYMIITQHLEVKKFWVSLIYPLLYIATVYVIIEPFFGDLMDQLMTTFESPRFVYPFLDPGNYERGVIGLILFNFGILTPLICLLSFLLNYLKFKLEKKLAT